MTKTFSSIMEFYLFLKDPKMSGVVVNSKPLLKLVNDVEYFKKCCKCVRKKVHGDLIELTKKMPSSLSNNTVLAMKDILQSQEIILINHTDNETLFKL